MKQFQFTFKDEETLDLELMKIRKWSMSNLYSVLLIRFYTEILDRDMIEHACVKIREQLPNAMPCLASPYRTMPLLWAQGPYYGSRPVYIISSVKKNVNQHPNQFHRPQRFHHEQFLLRQHPARQPRRV